MHSVYAVAAAAAVAVPSLALVAACGNPHKETLAENADFDCHQRYAAYVVSGSLTAAEVGVQIDCEEKGPRVRRWTVTKDGNREEYAGSLGVHEFDRMWEKIEGTGWRYLPDCEGTGQPTDPVYTFDVKDWNGTVSFSCTNAGPLPFPYNSIVDELDFKAAAAAPKDGDKPEPEDLR